jgi:hypothetical protein
MKKLKKQNVDSGRQLKVSEKKKVGLFFTKSEVSSAQAPAIIQDFTAH